MRRKNWSPVTLSFLLEMGARAVLWLNPGEEAGTHPIKFGAYAYSAADGGGGSAVYFYLKSDEQHRLDTTDVDLQGAGVEAPVEVARQTKDRKDASAAAHAAAAHNWSMLHDAVAMGNASLVGRIPAFPPIHGGALSRLCTHGVSGRESCRRASSQQLAHTVDDGSNVWPQRGGAHSAAAWRLSHHPSRMRLNGH